MLRLKNISKNYYVANYKIEALKDINISFRKNEFVAVLGPSGSGKTTLLNIVGGLDKYSEGNLIINGRETKDYKEKDWNVYRSHRVGFVFQSYNLIPHQTVLSNVELALTIAGISKEERIKRAKAALDKVGLHDQYYKKPNQLSGGQSQRVAIARALVNDPEILLADEPTGALDTKTSKQIMDLIKEIAEDRLVIMVTHNPELAEEYANRIVNLLDGEILNDSNPYNPKTETKAPEVVKKEHAKMSWFTSFKLSLQNLFTKKSRTVLTSVASSIGIIGISLVLSMSYGVQRYIAKTQEDMLSGNPIVISTRTLDLEAMMENMGPPEKLEVIKAIDKVGVDEVIRRLAERSQSTQEMFVENTITEEYIEYLKQMQSEDVATILFDRNLDVTNSIYFDFIEENGQTTSMSIATLKTIITNILTENEDTKAYASLIQNFTNIINEAPDNKDYILSQYNVVAGEVATKSNEIMVVLNRDGLISDLTLAQLGFYSQEQFQNVIFDVLNDANYNPNLEYPLTFEYDEFIGKEYRWHDNDAIFKLNPSMVRPFIYNAYEDDVIPNQNSLIGNKALKVVGILKLKDNIEYGSLSSGFYYTKAFSDYVIDINKDSQIVNTLNNFPMLKDTFNSMVTKDENDNDVYNGITFEYQYHYLGELRNRTGFVGQTDQFSNMMSTMPGMAEIPKIYQLTKRHLGGESIASTISIYPIDLKHKENVITYLKDWGNTDEGKNNPIVYTDALSIIFAMIHNIINVITIALIGFTSLALFVSSVMIAIITYVSVVERVKEIGVIRSLGGSKNDVSNLFISETFIIGLASAIIAILVTYLATFIINVIVKPEIGSDIAAFPFKYALIMTGISIFLTLVSGFIPSRSAAKKDPVVALRTE